ncbi:MAG: FHIPEP family type III secretion protein [Saprospiraceae bacterium]|nr:FHIPEP family type III secretion protein [Saprospiraceae bacterium]
MSHTSNIGIEINIRVPEGHPLAEEGQPLAWSQLSQYATALFQHLGVPGVVVVVREKQPPSFKKIEVAINGKIARLRHTTAHSLHDSLTAQVVALCDDLLSNRRLLITPDLVEAVAEKAHPSFRRFDANGQERIVQVLLAQGFGLQHLERFSPSETNTPEAWAEACIGDLEAVRFAMHAHPSQIDPDDNPHDFNRLVESADYFVDAAFKIKGIPFPKIRGEKRTDFAPNEMAFQINDLLFPTRPIGDMATENLQFVNFLTRHGALFLNRGSVNFLLDSLEAANPNLLALARTRFSTDFITTILRHLAVESISIRPLVRILEVLVSGGQDAYRQGLSASEAPSLSETVHLIDSDKRLEHLSLSEWAELVRVNLKNAIINRASAHFEEHQTLSCFYLENDLLQRVLRFDELDDGEQATLRERVCAQIAQNYHTPAGKIRPIITAAAWRKRISDLIAFEFPETSVFSLQECLPRIVARFEVMLEA